MDVSSGMLFRDIHLRVAHISLIRFGLLHRIPAVPETREPGSIPEELLEPPDEYEEQQLFVPADYADEPELPEHAEARIRWEQEEWEREAYARNYMHDSAVDPAANHTSSSAYDDSAEFDNESHSTDNIHNHSPMKGSPTTEETEDETGEESYKILAPTPVRPALRQDSVESTIIRIASSRSSSFSVARASTPTPTRPFGSFVNGDFSKRHLSSVPLFLHLNFARYRLEPSHSFVGSSHNRI